ncbi:unnamed protein product [Effrenium voratum]|uniref:VTT domain-containing protein n=1 Tax=Effrenium voratum TaxID=2562239 RepID=A0AA36HQC2_9DINO|nr:unnamed protein product [Effrenium voratum]
MDTMKMLEDPLYAREVVAYTNAVKAAAQHLADEEVQYAFTFAMSFGATRYPNIVMKCGGLQGVLAAMARYPKNERLQAECCETLRNIAEMPDGADTLLETNAMEAVLDSMRMNAQAEWVLQEGCGFICRMITEPRMGKLKDKAVAVATFGGFMAIGMAISSNPQLKERAVHMAFFMRANPLLGMALHAVLSTAITVSGIPFSLVDLGASWVYGFQTAMCMLLVAKTLGSILCFLVAHSLLPLKRKESIMAHPTVARVDRILSESPIYYGTLFRLALMPAFVKNYGLALLNIRFKHYITCCLLGSCFGVPAQAYLGSQLGDIYLGLRDAEAVAQSDPLVLLGGIAPALAMLVLMPTVAKVLLGSDEKDKDKADKAE